MFNDLYAIGENIWIGNDNTICQSCVDAIARKKNISKTNAARSMYGRFTGKKMVHIGNVMICDKCLKNFYNSFFEEEAKSGGNQ